MMFLPLAHVFARFIQVPASTARRHGSAHTAGHQEPAPGPAELPARRSSWPSRASSRRSTTAPCTRPRTAARARSSTRAADTAIAYSRVAGTAGKVPAGAQAQAQALRQAGLRQAARRDGRPGGACRLRRRPARANGSATSSAASACTILEGYGLTETTAAGHRQHAPTGSRSAPSAPRCPGNAIRIADDGEILAKGVCVLRGYFNTRTATAEAFEDGWFRTGDIGELDEDGFLRITGRKKEIIVTAGGKNVAPALLEDQIRADALVSPVPGRRRQPPVHRRAHHARRGGPARLAGAPRAARLA